MKGLQMSSNVVQIQYIHYENTELKINSNIHTIGIHFLCVKDLYNRDPRSLQITNAGVEWNELTRG